MLVKDLIEKLQKLPQDYKVNIPVYDIPFHVGVWTDEEIVSVHVHSGAVVLSTTQDLPNYEED